MLPGPGTGPGTRARCNAALQHRDRRRTPLTGGRHGHGTPSLVEPGGASRGGDHGRAKQRELTDLGRPTRGVPEERGRERIVLSRAHAPRGRPRTLGPGWRDRAWHFHRARDRIERDGGDRTARRTREARGRVALPARPVGMVASRPIRVGGGRHAGLPICCNDNITADRRVPGNGSSLPRPRLVRDSPGCHAGVPGRASPALLRAARRRAIAPKLWPPYPAKGYRVAGGRTRPRIGGRISAYPHGRIAQATTSRDRRAMRCRPRRERVVARDGAVMTTLQHRHGHPPGPGIHPLPLRCAGLFPGDPWPRRPIAGRCRKGVALPGPGRGHRRGGHEGCRAPGTGAARGANRDHAPPAGGPCARMELAGYQDASGPGTSPVTARVRPGRRPGCNAALQRRPPVRRGLPTGTIHAWGHMGVWEQDARPGPEQAGAWPEDGGRGTVGLSRRDRHAADQAGAPPTPRDHHRGKPTRSRPGPLGKRSR